MDVNACNYNPEATHPDRSCDYSCLGCTNPSACNYDIEATVDDNSCYLGFPCSDGSFSCRGEAYCPDVDEPPTVYCGVPGACNFGMMEHCVHPAECADGTYICEPPYGPGCECIRCRNNMDCPDMYFCREGFPGVGNCCVFDMDACLGSGVDEGECEDIGGLD